MNTTLPIALMRLQSLPQKIHDYQYWEVAIEGLQRFLTRGWVESERTIAQRKARADILHRQAINQVPLAGFASVELDPFDENSTRRAVDEGVFAASLSLNQNFTLVTPEQAQYKPVQLVDRTMRNHPKQALDLVEDAIRKILSEHEDVRLSSAEMFSESREAIFQNSLGLQAVQEDTLFTLLLVLLYTRGTDEVEVEIELRVRNLELLSLRTEVAEAIERVRRSVDAKLPETGSFDVVLTGEPLDHLWKWVIHQTSASAAYAKTSTVGLGQSLASGKIDGDFLNLWTDAALDYGVRSYVFDGFGQPAGRTQLVRGSLLHNRWGSKRYADYLQMPSTGDLGMILVEPGRAGEADILASRDGKPVHLIDQFSYFSPNAVTGAFSAEIRSGLEIKGAKRQPIKGGSISGVMNTALRQMYLSEVTTQRSDYLGPKFIRFNGLTIAGR